MTRINWSQFTDGPTGALSATRQWENRSSAAAAAASRVILVAVDVGKTQTIFVLLSQL